MERYLFYKDSDVLFLHGDCLEIIPILSRYKISMVLVDPPYGKTPALWDKIIDFNLMWEKLNAVILPQAPILVFGIEPFSSLLRLSNLKNYKYDWIWDTVNKITNHLNAKKQPMRRHENISVFYSKQCCYNPIMREGTYISRKTKALQSKSFGKVTRPDVGRKAEGLNPVSILEFPSHKTNNRFHQCEKPVPLLEYFIETYSLPNDIILDFTIGSGSTAVAAKNLGRRCVGIDTDIKSLEIAKKRVLGEL